MSSALDERAEDSDTDDELAVTVDIKPEKFTWTIEKFSEVAKSCVATGGKYYSDEWTSGGCRWRLLMFPNGNPTSQAGTLGKSLSLYLDVPDREALPSGWRRQARFWLNVVDQKDASKTHKQETNVTLSSQTPDYGFPQLLQLANLKDPNNGFMVDDRIIVEAELVVQKVWTETHTMSHYSYNTRKDLGHVGLRNQGATCYLNSLMQGLFHVGAFRRSVYMMATSSEDVTKSIPLALQRLFYRMQFSDEAPGTKELTRSFGWSDYESFKQHDVQELNRVLMDNLETKMKGTPVQDSEGYIERLFKGQMENFIRCLNVPFKSSRAEDFYDLSLVVKGLKDIYESIDKYVETETLDGQNKYQAEGFGLQDAHKGIRFLSLPPVLNIQLKRWEMDYVRFQPYKVNDLYMFYPILDMSRYLDRSVNQDSGIYHLHAVLVHSGGVHGGHYYAYIRPTSKLQWFKFNDASVSSASEKEAVDDNWGGDEVTRYSRYGKVYSYTYPRSANAYMLIYVRETEMHRYMNDDCSDVIPAHLAQANEEHLCVDLRVATEENFANHDQTLFDLVALNEITPQRFKRTDTIEMFKARAAEVFGIPVERQRYWIFQVRRNKTVRPLRSLTTRELAEAIQYLRPLQSYSVEFSPMLFLLPDDPDPATNAPRPIGETSEDKEDSTLIFFKLFDPAESKVHYIGHGIFSRQSTTIAQVEARFRQIVGERVAANQKLLVWEEVKPDRIDPIDPIQTLTVADLRNGDILLFMVEQTPEQAATFTHPTPVEWYPYIREKLVVEFRNFNTPEDASPTARFSLECQKSFAYEDVQRVVGEHLKVDPAKIRFTGFSPSTNAPRHVPCERGVGMTLPKMIKWYNDVCPDILYYEILTARLDQIENMKKIKIEFQCANLSSLKVINLLVPKNGFVQDIFPILQEQKEVAEVLASDPALGLTFNTKEFRLFEVWNGKIGRSYKARDPVNTSFYEYSLYMVQEMSPEECSGFDNKLHKWVQICHFQMGLYSQPLPFGKPFYMVINNTDTVAQVREKIRTRLQLTAEDISSWKMALIANYRAKYLEDSQLAGELQFDDYSSYIGLEHVDDTKKNYPVAVASTGSDRPSRGGDAGIVIRN